MRKFEPKTHNQQIYLQSITKNKITFVEGPAGTGKSYIATIFGITALLNKEYSKFIIGRPLVQSGEDTGFLPGGINEKLDPYVRPIYDILEHSTSKGALQTFTKDGKIEICPFAYMRGRTFHESYVLLDECQNCSYEQLILALTRLGKNSKIVLTGDSSQTDLKEHARGGYLKIISKLQGLKDIGMVKLVNQDIVREELIQRILERLDEEKK